MSFKEKVAQVVNSIPYGKVTTYGTVSTLAGLPRGARLVGGILHYQGEKLPWYKVVNRHGFISTKCLDYPKKLQKALLEQEGIEVDSNFMINLVVFGWFPL